MQLKRKIRSLPWLSVILLLQRSPAIPWAKNIILSFGNVAEKVWSWKILLPASAYTGSWHALSGATTYVTSNQTVSSSLTSGDSFSFSFYNHGYKAYSYKVENLPNGLSYNNSISGPKITGTLPAAGTYNISITGYRYPELSGNQTPVYTLSLNVKEAESSSTTEEISSSASLWSDSSTNELGNGWYRSNWFGDFFGNSGGWTYHMHHGWLYLHGNDENNLWIYDETLGWLYTGKNLFPKLYQNSNSKWLYDQSIITERKFWDYSTSSSFPLSKN